MVKWDVVHPGLWKRCSRSGRPPRRITKGHENILIARRQRGPFQSLPGGSQLAHLNECLSTCARCLRRLCLDCAALWKLSTHWTFSCNIVTSGLFASPKTVNAAVALPLASKPLVHPLRRKWLTPSACCGGFD